MQAINNLFDRQTLKILAFEAAYFGTIEITAIALKKIQAISNRDAIGKTGVALFFGTLPVAALINVVGLSFFENLWERYMLSYSPYIVALGITTSFVFMRYAMKYPMPYPFSSLPSDGKRRRSSSDR